MEFLVSCGTSGGTTTLCSVGTGLIVADPEPLDPPTCTRGMAASAVCLFFDFVKIHPLHFSTGPLVPIPDCFLHGFFGTIPWRFFLSFYYLLLDQSLLELVLELVHFLLSFSLEPFPLVAVAFFRQQRSNFVNRSVARFYLLVSQEVLGTVSGGSSLFAVTPIVTCSVTIPALDVAHVVPAFLRRIDHAAATVRPHRSQSPNQRLLSCPSSG